MSVFDDLINTLSKLRKVKYGDVVLSSDHNDLVDSVNALSDLILPSRINPLSVNPLATTIYHFMDTQFTQYYDGHYIYALLSNVIEPSKTSFNFCFPKYSIEIGTPIIKSYFNNVLFENLFSLRELIGKFYVCCRFVKKQPLYLGDRPIVVGLHFEDSQNYDVVYCDIAFLYGKDENDNVVDSLMVLGKELLKPL